MHLPRLAALVAAYLLVSVAPAAAQGWGALAFSENENRTYSHSRNYRTREGAMQGALGECAKHAADCKVYATFQNTCVALAGASNGAFGWAYHYENNPQGRDARAIQECQKQQGTNCQIVLRFCTGTTSEAPPDSPIQPPPARQPPPQQPPTPPPGEQPNPKE